jgi:hypothetical protein
MGRCGHGKVNGGNEDKAKKIGKKPSMHKNHPKESLELFPFLTKIVPKSTRAAKDIMASYGSKEGT